MNENAIKERIFVVLFDELPAISDEVFFNKISKIYCDKGLVYEKKTKWDLQLDLENEIPKIGTDSKLRTEHQFKKIGSDGVEEYVFRITNTRVIFNYLLPFNKNNSLDTMYSIFLPLWNEFIKLSELSSTVQIILCYNLRLNRKTLSNDSSLFKENWLEVNKICSLLGNLDDFPCESKYLHPFSSNINWQINNSTLGEIKLSSGVESKINKDNLLSLVCLLDAKVEIKCEEISLNCFRILFSSLTDLKNIVLKPKAIKAIEEDWI